MSRRPLSLTARSSLAVGVALLLFLGATGLVLDHAYAEGATSGLRDRLQAYVYTYLARFDISRAGKLIPPDTLPNPAFSRPGSGLYALVEGPGDMRWKSPSAIGLELPVAKSLAPARTAFAGPLVTSRGRVYVLSQGVAWVMPDGEELLLTLHVAENEGQILGQMRAFRRTLVVWLAGIGFALLLLQILLTRWSLSPLGRMAQDLRRIESGERQRLPGGYPVEVAGFAKALNNFIEREQGRIERSRNVLADLAHSLKTPLAVMRARLETDAVNDDTADDLAAQVQRMDDLVAYQLKRAATSGRPVYAAPIEIVSEAEALVQSLEKVYASKNILCEFDIPSNARFYGERGDLLELLGNLLENAFKWARHRVVLTASVLPQAGRARPGLELAVEDDGPGIPVDQIEQVLQRGVSGDQRIGHGIGLAIVQDIAQAYAADLEVGPSRALGGASFVVRFLP